MRSQGQRHQKLLAEAAEKLLVKPNPLETERLDREYTAAPCAEVLFATWRHARHVLGHINEIQVLCNTWNCLSVYSIKPGYAINVASSGVWYVHQSKTPEPVATSNFRKCASGHLIALSRARFAPLLPLRLRGQPSSRMHARSSHLLAKMIGDQLLVLCHDLRPSLFTEIVVDVCPLAADASLHQLVQPQAGILLRQLEVSKRTQRQQPNPQAGTCLG